MTSVDRTLRTMLDRRNKVHKLWQKAALFSAEREELRDRLDEFNTRIDRYAKRHYPGLPQVLRGKGLGHKD